MENKPLVEKVLRSGLITADMANLMEHFGYLAPGSAEKTQEDKLDKAPRRDLYKLANDLAEEIEKEHLLRETYLDLERLRWPVEVWLKSDKGVAVASELTAVVDRSGRYFFRIQDVDPKWFVPGYLLARHTTSLSCPDSKELVREIILEKQILFIGDQPACLQVTTSRV